MAKTIPITVHELPRPFAGPPIHLTEGDGAAYQLHIRVVGDDGSFIDYSAVKRATLAMATAFGGGAVRDVEVLADKIVYVLKAEDLAYPGNGVASLQLFDESDVRLSTAQFSFVIVSDLTRFEGSPQVVLHIDRLSELMKRAETTIAEAEEAAQQSAAMAAQVEQTVASAENATEAALAAAENATPCVYQGALDPASPTNPAWQSAKNGDTFMIEKAGVLSGVAFVAGDMLVVRRDVVGMPTAADWDVFPSMTPGGVGSAEEILEKLQTVDGVGSGLDAERIGGKTAQEMGLPVGALVPAFGTLLNSDYLLCDGAVFDKLAYPALFSVLGSEILPDLRGRVLVGLDSAQTEFNAIGKTGGEKTHKLTEAELASHKHKLYPTIPKDNAWIAPNCGMNYSFTNGAVYEQDFLKPTGGDQPHNNLQPYMTVNHYIKAR